jgi:hypothetical protein
VSSKMSKFLINISASGDEIFSIDNIFPLNLPLSPPLKE